MLKNIPNAGDTIYGLEKKGNGSLAIDKVFEIFVTNNATYSKDSFTATVKLDCDLVFYDGHCVTHDVHNPTGYELFGTLEEAQQRVNEESDRFVAAYEAFQQKLASKLEAGTLTEDKINYLMEVLK